VKNPWMSLWLSGANSFAGAARGMMGAEMRRQQLAFMRAMTESAERAWMDMVASSMRQMPPRPGIAKALAAPPAPPKRKVRARRMRKRPQ
jgi:hypothetical protein